ncbi:protein CURLY FLAG LEAF 1 [Corylus avellana]|uniref:protein CURLY FLAG LEAF 1 n=1 Tax=Corylus avellana TaxID=13451 RepID=UPI001E21F300|nr:protein CURLY FLAG LEAF 1 [Corylus avellana]
MAADVSALVRVLNGYSKEDQHRAVGNDSSCEKSTALITRDLLGGSSSSTSKLVESQELDLDLQVPNGWEKRLDLKSGKVYLQRCSTPNSPSISEHKHQTNPTVPKLQDLNFPPSPSKITLNLFEESCLDLKLISSSSSSSNNYQSVCTLDKVKSALERAEKEPVKKRSSFWKSSVSPSYSSSSSSIKETQEEEHEDKLSSSPIAAGCPGCLSYVLITKNNPKCPRCASVVPLPMIKKPRIDLNISI